VLHLLLRPGGDDRLELRVVGEHAVEIGGVVPAVEFHHGGGLHQLDDLRIDPRGIESGPGNLFQRPVLHRRATTELT
jgi:hypothetical protein